MSRVPVLQGVALKQPENLAVRVCLAGPQLDRKVNFFDQAGGLSGKAWRRREIASDSRLILVLV